MRNLFHYIFQNDFQNIFQIPIPILIMTFISLTGIYATNLFAKEVNKKIDIEIQSNSYEEPTFSIPEELKNRISILDVIRADNKMLESASDVQKQAKDNAKNIKIEKGLFQDNIQSGKQVNNRNKSNKSSGNPSEVLIRNQSGQLYVFISKSVPLKTLQTYTRMLARLNNGVMVMNGYVGDPVKIKPTFNFIHDVLKKNSDCEPPECQLHNVEIDINPILFTQYGISRVPAFVWVDKPQDSFCDDDMKPLPESKVTVFEGDADLIYVLESLYQHTKNPEINNIVMEYYAL